MKKQLQLLLIVFMLALGVNTVNAQCPGCMVNTSCFVPGGGLCPDSIPAGTQGQPYDEDITAYLPATIDAAPFSNGLLGFVPLVSVKINSISGMPFGLVWQCGNPGNMFYPASGDTIGCVKICGIPIASPGVYNIVINVTAVVDAGPVLGYQSAQINFDLQMVLLPNTSGNIAFNYSPNSACDSGSITFTPNITAALPQLVSYSWDFGNNVTSNSPTPPAQIYAAPGDYPVTLITTINRLTLTSFNTSLSGNFWCGDVEEPNLPFVGCTATPDPYFKFTSGSSTYQSGWTTNVNASWTGIDFPLESTFVAIQVWDDDNVSPDDDGGTATLNITGPGTYGYSTSSPWGGGTAGSFVIGLTVDTVITVTDTIHIYSSPAAPILTAAQSAICEGDSTLLTVDPGFNYVWYHDSLVVANTSVNEYMVMDDGEYYVKIVNPQTGCLNYSNSVTIDYHPDIPFNFAIVWNGINGYLQSNINGNYSYQWMFDNGSGWNNIPAPAGAQSNYTPTANGQYMLVATTVDGCIDTTNIYTFNNLGEETFGDLSSLNVFPVPSSGELNVQLQLSNEVPVEIRLMDMIGKTLFNDRFENQSGFISKQYRIDHLPSGSYILDVTLPEGSLRKRVIKQ
jgi:hypothetical protein